MKEYKLMKITVNTQSDMEKGAIKNLIYPV
jgi:hypothetical protein